MGCGRCAEVCPHGVFAVDGGRAAVVDGGACMECGACRRNCPVDAIAVLVGTGCAVAVINGLLRGREDCCCGEDDGGCC